jgi:hypothetical protein
MSQCPRSPSPPRNKISINIIFVKVGQEEDTQGSYQTKDISDWSWDDFAQYLKDLGGDQSCLHSPSSPAEGRSKDTEVESDRERQLY